MSIRTYFENIADAIKDKNPNVTNVTPEEMPNAIRSIPSGSSSASGVTYDNTTSGLYATNVQDAIDEVVGDITTINSDLSELNNKLTTDANWIQLGSTCVQYRKVNGIVFVAAYSQSSLGALSGSFGTLPEGYRPPIRWLCRTGAIQGGSGGRSEAYDGSMQIETNGNVNWSLFEDNGYFSAHTSYPAV